MIKPGNNPFIRKALHYYVKWITKRHFNSIQFDPVAIDNSKAVLLIANHFSYWDSLILYMVCCELFRKKFHVMVNEDTMLRERYLKHGGAFSVNKKSKDIAHSLSYAAELLNDPQNLVLIFPQGKLYSNFVNHIHFEKGMIRVMEKAGDKFQVIFAATFTQYLQHKKPTATVYLKNEEHAGKTFRELEMAYQKHYDNGKLQQIEIVI